MRIQLGDDRPVLAADSWMAPNATLIGRVTLREAASVWFGAVLRADNEPIVVGERTNIQDLCVLHTDPGWPLTIEGDCTIGHKVMLHGCTIGAGSMVGMNAVVLNGARIGRNCLIGAGALVPEGAEIPDRSLVIGLPGRVKRELTDDEVTRLMATAGRYVERARQYAMSAVVITDAIASE